MSVSSTRFRVHPDSTTPGHRPSLAVVRRFAVTVIAAGAAIALAVGAAPAAQAVTGPTSHTVTSTVDAGAITRDLAFDASSDRLFVPIDRGAGTPGAIGWIDTTTGETSAETIELTDAEPQSLVVDTDAHALYVLHYRSSTLTVIDTTTNSVTSVIAGVPSYPGDMALDTVTGELYIASDGIVTVDPSTGSVSAEVPISTQKYPSIGGIAYDASNRLLWVVEGRAGVVTAFSSVTKTWMDSVATPVGAFVVDGAPLGGRAKSLALDEGLGHLYLGVDPTFADDWDDTKLLILDTTTARYLGSPIELGDTTRELAVNPTSHEVYAANGFSNTFSVVSPDTWSVTETIDFTALGITGGTGTANADTWALATDASGERSFVSHPYGTARVSTITRTGAVPTVTELDASPGQEPTEPQEPAVLPWAGPGGAVLDAAPEDAVTTTGQSLSWSVSDYARAWTSDQYGAVAKTTDDELVFTGGTGWSSPSTGETQLTWTDGFRLRQYPVLAPEVSTTFGNPVLSIDPDGSGSLTFDVAWTVSGTEVSNGFSRVEVATFAPGSVSLQGETIAFAAEPEFTGRPYTDEAGTVHADSYPASFVDWLSPSIQAWWFTTGASLDRNKHPNPVSVAFIRVGSPTGTVEPTDPTGPVAPVDPSGPGGPSDPVDTVDLATAGAPEPALAATGASVGVGAVALMLLTLGAVLVIRRRRANDESVTEASR